MAVFTILIFTINIIELWGSEYDGARVLIHPSQAVLPFRVGETLNLTCSLSKHDVVGDLHLEWDYPKTVNSKNKVDRMTSEAGLHWVTMVIRNLQESDAGEYKCSASSNTNPDLQSFKSIRINVKRKRQQCAETMFHCQPDNCIYKRYTCDGYRDCKGGEDEAESLCGVAPCRGKIPCTDGRCIPTSWCCNPLSANCTHTASTRLPCCYVLRGVSEESHLLDSHVTQRYNDVAFFQTTVYTVIGCAMAFMLIVTILVIAICRVHMRRTLMPARCPAGDRSGGSGQHYALPFHDMDCLFTRPSNNPMLVTYNINNGVQFVGRPVDPPPYCETVATPPREGPPPPYVSTENLAAIRETTAKPDDEEPCETDSLLPPADQPISIISSRLSRASNSSSDTMRAIEIFIDRNGLSAATSAGFETIRGNRLVVASPPYSAVDSPQIGSLTGDVSCVVTSTEPMASNDVDSSRDSNVSISNNETPVNVNFNATPTVNSRADSNDILCTANVNSNDTALFKSNVESQTESVMAAAVISNNFSGASNSENNLSRAENELISNASNTDNG